MIQTNSLQKPATFGVTSGSHVSQFIISISGFYLERVTLRPSLRHSRRSGAHENKKQPIDCEPPAFDHSVCKPNLHAFLLHPLTPQPNKLFTILPVLVQTAKSDTLSLVPLNAVQWIGTRCPYIVARMRREESYGL
jgi:hypothetical protein